MKDQLDKEVPLENAITGAEYLLQPLDRLGVSQRHLEAITSICNEGLVYEWCFRELCGGAPYPQSMASDWIRWSIEGWEEGTHFVYVVTDADGVIAAACDIKSAEMEGAEIGYWSSAGHRGVMTNAVRAVVNLADRAGYRLLYADIHPDNRRSQSVIQRCGFLPTHRQPGVGGHASFERIRPSS